MLCSVFERVEKKYLLSERQHNAFVKALEGRMEPDAYGLHTIGNIYFDTPTFELIRASLNGPAYKEKLRLRCYNLPKADSMVFVELKKKYQGVVYKRREQMKLSEAVRYLTAGLKPEKDSQILREIDWFLNVWRPLPRMMISYDRVAFFHPEDPELRLTFDKNIRWRDTELDLSKGAHGTPLLEQGKILLEIKIPGAMPLWLCEILTDLAIYPVSFSKYGSCYKTALLQKTEPKKGGVICA